MSESIYNIVSSQEQSKKVVQSGNNLGLAARVDMCNNSDDVNNNTCILCHGNYYISDCLEFPDARSKLEQLKILKRCLRCTRLGHLSPNCKFRFKYKCFLVTMAFYFFVQKS